MQRRFRIFTARPYPKYVYTIILILIEITNIIQCTLGKTKGIVVDTSNSKYWMPIQYDIIGDGQNQTDNHNINQRNNLLFSK